MGVFYFKQFNSFKGNKSGPEKCSGLPIVRYSAESLHAEFGEHFVLKEQLYETHKTPFDTTQQFVFCHFVKKG